MHMIYYMHTVAQMHITRTQYAKHVHLPTHSRIILNTSIFSKKFNFIFLTMCARALLHRAECSESVHLT